MKKVLALILTLVTVMSLTSGCISHYVTSTEETEATAATQATQAEEAGSTAAEAESTEKQAVDINGTTLEVWYAVSGTSGETFTAQSNAFAAANGVTLNMSYSGGSSDTATKVSAALLSGTQPDVALMYAGPLYTGGRDDYTIGELMDSDADFDKSDIFEGMLDYCVYMGQDVCAVPYGISTQVMYYNKDILKAAGVDMTNPPKTWAEFLEVCKTVLEKGNVNGTENFTAFDTTDEAWLFKSMLMQNGCQIVTLEDGVVTPVFNDAQALEVAEYWSSLISTGVMAASEHDAAENKFLAGNLAFVAASSNRISRWTGTTSFELGAIEMPYFTTPSLALGGNVLVILTDKSDPDYEQKLAAAWEYVKYLTNVENNTAFAMATGYLPIHKSAMEQEAVKTAMAENEMYAIAFKQLDYTWAYTHFEQMGTMDVQLNSMLGKLEKGRGTAQDLLDKAVKTLKKEIEEG